MEPVQDALTVSISTDRSERVFMTPSLRPHEPYGRREAEIDLKRGAKRPFGTAFDATPPRDSRHRETVQRRIPIKVE
jgi:hypothetical protein